MVGLTIAPLDYKPLPPVYPPSKCAWVVCLLTSPSYLPGILVLAHSLKKHNSLYPLVVAVNPALPEETKQAVRDFGLEVREVEPLVPVGKVTTIAERFVDTWTKCAVFNFVEYERIILIDGDMMLKQNMDELFNIPLKEDEIAANFACVCNLDRSGWAPKEWVKENCGYNGQTWPTATHSSSPSSSNPTSQASLLNSGLVVLTPSNETMSRITNLLTSTKSEDQERVASWMFPDQDLLAYIFRGKWVALPWTYNAIKTMRYWHGDFYRDEEVRNLHYIIDKPWQRRPERNSSEEKQKTGLAYKVDATGFEGIMDGVVSGPKGDRTKADAITHGWWWEEYEELVEEMRGEGYGHVEYMEKLVAK